MRLSGIDTSANSGPAGRPAAGPLHAHPQVGMAHTLRVAKRKGAAADTDLVADVEAVEEDLAAEEEDGVPLEAFNLKVCVGGGGTGCRRCRPLLPAACCTHEHSSGGVTARRPMPAHAGRTAQLSRPRRPLHLRLCRLHLPQEERRRGYFDESGNYVEREDKEEAEATDAWLTSEEGGR